MKKKRKFSSHKSKFGGIGCKVIFELPNLWGNAQIFNHTYCAVSHIWPFCTRSLLNFLAYEENFILFFISVHLGQISTRLTESGKYIWHGRAQYCKFYTSKEPPLFEIRACRGEKYRRERKLRFQNFNQKYLTKIDVNIIFFSYLFHGT